MVVIVVNEEQHAEENVKRDWMTVQTGFEHTKKTTVPLLRLRTTTRILHTIKLQYEVKRGIDTPSLRRLGMYVL